MKLRCLLCGRPANAATVTKLALPNSSGSPVTSCVTGSKRSKTQHRKDKPRAFRSNTGNDGARLARVQRPGFSLPGEFKGNSDLTPAAQQSRTTRIPVTSVTALRSLDPYHNP